MMFLSNFEIEEFCPLYSDAHNAIKFALKGNVMPTQPKMSSCQETKHKRWEENKKDLFFENLNQNKVDEILNTLNDMTQPNKDDINAIMSKIEDIFKTTSNNTFAKRVGLWGKLLSYNISGKILTIIKNMYSDIKSCVSLNGDCSTFFYCKNGLRQGENLSPILFSLF